MNRSRLVLIALVAAMAALLSAITVLSVRWLTAPRVAHPAAAAGQSLGFTRLSRPAPPVDLPSLTGSGTVSLARQGHLPIVLNFWASTCGPCKSETPVLASAARALAGKVAFAGVDTADDRGAARKFEAGFNVPYPSGFDPATTVASRYGVPGLPATFFISPDGSTIVGEYLGALTPSKLRAILSQLYHIN